MKEMTHWRTRDGRAIAITSMDDEHLENSINMLMREIGPALMLYEMGRILCPDPLKLDYDMSREDATRHRWKYLCVMRKERKRRDTMGIKIPRT